MNRSQDDHKTGSGSGCDLIFTRYSLSSEPADSFFNQLAVKYSSGGDFRHMRRKMKSAIVCAVVLCVASLAIASNVPTGWKVAKDHKGVCQCAVPPDWKVGTFGDGTAPDGKSSIIVSNAPQTMAQIKENSKMTYTLEKIVEDAASRYWYTFKAHSPGHIDDTNWYVAVPAGSSVTCIATISFKDAAMEPMAKQIVDTIGPAK
jgi:hypothetical protein